MPRAKNEQSGTKMGSKLPGWGPSCRPRMAAWVCDERDTPQVVGETLVYSPKLVEGAFSEVGSKKGAGVILREPRPVTEALPNVNRIFKGRW